MNARTVVIGIGVATGIVGLGFLAHYIYSGEKEEQENDNPIKEAEKTEVKQIETKLVEKKHRIKPPRKMPMIKPEPKMQIVEAEEIKPPIADEFPLRLGSEGKRVVRLQVWLMRNYGWTGKVTGIFDEKTEKLLKKAIKETQLDAATYNEMKMEKPVHEQIIKR